MITRVSFVTGFEGDGARTKSEREYRRFAQGDWHGPLMERDDVMIRPYAAPSEQG